MSLISHIFSDRYRYFEKILLAIKARIIDNEEEALRQFVLKDIEFGLAHPMPPGTDEPESPEIEF